jgi:hypothetical protein
MKKIKESIVVALERDTMMLELSLAWFSIIWGGWILAPWQSFPTNPHGSFKAMMMLASEPVWGALFFIAGLHQLWAVLFGSHTLRRLSAWGSMQIWIFVCVSAIISSWKAPPGGLYAVVAMSNFVAVMALARKGGQNANERV